jgi:hypothetical protein
VEIGARGTFPAACFSLLEGYQTSTSDNPRHEGGAASAAPFSPRKPAGSRLAHQNRVVDAAPARQVGRGRSRAACSQPEAEFRQSHLGTVFLDQPRQPDPPAPLAAPAADLEPLEPAHEITERHDLGQARSPLPDTAAVSDNLRILTKHVFPAVKLFTLKVYLLLSYAYPQFGCRAASVIPSRAPAVNDAPLW